MLSTNGEFQKAVEACDRSQQYLAVVYVVEDGRVKQVAVAENFPQGDYSLAREKFRQMTEGFEHSKHSLSRAGTPDGSREATTMSGTLSDMQRRPTVDEVANPGTRTMGGGPPPKAAMGQRPFGFPTAPIQRPE